MPWLRVRSDEECQGFGDGGGTIQEGGDEFLIDSQCDFLAEGAEDIQPSDETQDRLSSATAVIRTRTVHVQFEGVGTVSNLGKGQCGLESHCRRSVWCGNR